jgi:hypothetical protein
MKLNKLLNIIIVILPLIAFIWFFNESNYKFINEYQQVMHLLVIVSLLFISLLIYLNFKKLSIKEDIYLFLLSLCNIIIIVMYSIILLFFDIDQVVVTFCKFILPLGPISIAMSMFHTIKKYNGSSIKD